MRGAIMASLKTPVVTYKGVGLSRGFLLLLCVPLIALLCFQLPSSLDDGSPPQNQESAHAVPCTSAENGTLNCAALHRSLFPQRFVFGTATAAYQVEGAFDEGGRTQSIWDTFSRIPGKISDGSNGDVASDQYHKYQGDIELMMQLHVDAYRFSISWSRLMKLDGSVPELNADGVAYYNHLIDGLLAKGIQPYVTLYHWDLPQIYQDAFGGWLSQKIVKVYADYAEACFAAFGDRVKHWITFNEPQQFSVLGFGLGIHAPGRCSTRSMCAEGNSATEPYIVAHHVLLAHAAAVDIYRRKFKATQSGVVGIALDCEWGEPLTSSREDVAAAERHVEFQLAWYLDPIYNGSYPTIMHQHVGDRLPEFSKDEIALLQGSLDFIGLNHYTSRFISNGLVYQKTESMGHFQDQQVNSTVVRNGQKIGNQAASDWLFIVPWGLQKTLSWITKRYNKPALYVTENGMDDLEEAKPLEEMLNDTRRVHFYQDYLTSVLAAIRDGADVQGYFAWSLMDNFEWAAGYTRRFGLYYVDYKDDQKRYPKASAEWFSHFLDKMQK
ncbi:unnamed protein product [Sphagnum jensenii]|uniref:Beta-glucosidase n=1 Tax=Sphagnum jensenii TaxID=128206 RepID=A0ABP1B9M0_9BRYO